MLYSEPILSKRALVGGQTVSLEVKLAIIAKVFSIANDVDVSILIKGNPTGSCFILNPVKSLLSEGNLFSTLIHLLLQLLNLVLKNEPEREDEFIYIQYLVSILESSSNVIKNRWGKNGPTTP